jgi:hypothetical protein
MPKPSKDNLHERVEPDGTTKGGWHVNKFKIPPSQPADATLRIKGVPAIEGVDFEKNGRVFTLLGADASIFSTFQLYDAAGTTLLWEWSPKRGDLFGP